MSHRSHTQPSNTVGESTQTTAEATSSLAQDSFRAQTFHFNMLQTNDQSILPSVFQCVSPVFPAFSFLHPAVVLGLPVKRVTGNNQMLPAVLSMRSLNYLLATYFIILFTHFQ